MQFGLFEQPPRRYDSLEELLAEMVELTDDPLAGAGTTMVIYRGNPEARLMIVGEAPGPGKPAGQTVRRPLGQLLDQILQAAGFDRSRRVHHQRRLSHAAPVREIRPFASRRTKRSRVTSRTCWR